MFQDVCVPVCAANPVVFLLSTCVARGNGLNSEVPPFNSPLSCDDVDDMLVPLFPERERDAQKDDNDDDDDVSPSSLNLKRYPERRHQHLRSTTTLEKSLFSRGEQVSRNIFLVVSSLSDSKEYSRGGGKRGIRFDDVCVL